MTEEHIRRPLSDAEATMLLMQGWRWRRQPSRPVVSQGLREMVWPGNGSPPPAPDLRELAA